MKNLIISSVQEIAQHPKTAITVTSLTTVSGFFHWVEANISLMSGIIGLIGSVILVIIQIKKSRREKKEHELKVKLMEKELNE